MTEALQEANSKLRQAVEARIAAKAAGCCDGGRCHPRAIDTSGPMVDVDQAIAEEDERTPDHPFEQVAGMSMPQMEAAWAGVKARVAEMQERIREPASTNVYAAAPQSSSGTPEAERLLGDVLGIVRDRRAKYGPPSEHFARTVGAINAIFAHKLKEPLTLGDWAQIMILDKLARHQEKPQRDNPADTAGYAGCWAEVEPGL